MIIDHLCDHHHHHHLNLYQEVIHPECQMSAKETNFLVDKKRGRFDLSNKIKLKISDLINALEM